MTHLDIFGQFRPFAIGFDRYFEDLERMSNISQTNYPPYNVVKVDEEHFAVELAVAGFSKKDISITKEKNVLVIEGKLEDKSKDFVHKGLASRAFKRSWTLSDDIVIEGAELKDGILSVSLEKVIPEEDKPVEIKIS
tara:strand:- start:2755 stop:3165 length:411 start_codon:yes stop_codon:yes gene_type:complete